MLADWKSRRVSLTAVVAVLLAVGIFVADAFVPLGVAGGVPYVAVILVALNVPSRRFVIALGIACSILTVTDVFISVGPGNTEWWKVIVNRCLALGAIWVTVWLGLQRNLAQESYRQRLDELARLNRLKTVEYLAAALAHELNQPLTAIALQAEVAAQSAEAVGHESLKTTLGEIADQSHRASSIIQTLRGLIQKADSVRTRIPLQRLIRTAVDLIESTARQHRVELRLELAQHLPDVRVDPIQIEQVLLNLLQNGIDALAQSSLDQRIITISAKRASPNSIQVTISDNGPGVSPGLQQHLFEPFATSKPQGMGLGLSLSRSLVESHGGTLTYEPRDGAAFSITLPAVTPQ